MTTEEANSLERDHVELVICQHCLRKFELKVNKADLVAWVKGTKIQFAMPYLTDDERELLISQTCGECWDELFKEDEAGTTDYGCLLAIVIVGLLIMFGPWLLFWSIGVLFDYHIEFTFRTWLAAIVLMSLVGGAGSSKS